MARKDALLRLRERLLTRRDVLREKLSDEMNETLPGAFAGSGDLADSASDDTQSELSSQLAALESRELVQVERAIELMREGRYGHCEMCDEAIPVARLNALPYTLMCIDCQRKQERRHMHGESEAANWESAYEHEGRMSDRELTLGDLDLEG